MLTTFDLDEYVFQAMRAGAAGFLLKATPPDRLAEAVRVVAAGESLLDPLITRRLVEHFLAQPSTDPERQRRARGPDRARARDPAPAGPRAVERRRWASCCS